MSAGEGRRWGACGVEDCTDCRPLYDADNNPIPDRCEECGAVGVRLYTSPADEELCGRCAERLYGPVDTL